MHLRDFLAKTLPSNGNGNYYVATVTPKKTPPFDQIAVKSIPELIDKIEQLTDKHKDIYFGTASYGKDRTAKEVVLKKAIYLDLDCGVGYDFPDKNTAGREFIAFCKAAALPRPSIMVDSGNGLHIYWTLTTAITNKKWQPLADALKEACNEHNFLADPSVTADSARIMRAPETVNYKNIKNPKPCKVFKDYDIDYTYDELRHALLNWMAPVPLETVPSILQDGGALSSGMGSQFIPYVKHILPQCGVLAEVVATGGRGNDDPRSCHVGQGYKEVFWQQILYFLAFCGDGGEYVHKVSEKHLGYTQRSTETKYAQQLIKAQDPGKAPTLCSTFEQYLPDKCKACKHKGSFKCPTALGKPPATDLPHGYSQDSHGVMRMIEDEKVYILPYRVEDFSVGFDSAGNGLIIGMDGVIAGKAYRIEFDALILGDSKQVNKELAIHGIALNTHQIKEFMHLMTTWTQQMQRAKAVHSTTKSFGWFTQKNRTGFAAANKLFWDDGTEDTSIVPYRDLAAMYTPSGTLDVWKQVANFVVEQGRQGINISIASAFASPLIKFTGVAGLTLAVISEKSGTGKSTGLKVAQSVWGHPVKGINSLNDTTNSVVRKLGVLNNLPAYWDELRIREDVEGFIKMMFQIGQGKEKSRLTQSSSFQDMGTWNLLMTVASNEYLTDHIDQIVQASDAGRRRVFEITVDDHVNTKADPAHMAMFHKLESNYGEAGMVYTKYISENRKEVEALVHKCMAHFSSKLQTSNDERFWLAFMAATLAGSHLAKKLGLINFDMKGMSAYLEAEFLRMRGDTGESYEKPAVRAYDYVVNYLNDNAANTATVDKLTCRGSGPNVVVNLDVRSPIMAEVAATKWIRMDKNKFMDYVYKKGGQPSSILKDLETSLPSFSMTRASLGRGVMGYVGGRIRCIDISMDDTGIKPYFN